jgi:REP element-mobilizing transposase RayT
MSRYRRATVQGGAFFFTLALADRSSDLLVREIERLRHGAPRLCPPYGYLRGRLKSRGWPEQVRP